MFTYARRSRTSQRRSHCLRSGHRVRTTPNRLSPDCDGGDLRVKYPTGESQGRRPWSRLWPGGRQVAVGLARYPIVALAVFLGLSGCTEERLTNSSNVVESPDAATDASVRQCVPSD